MVALDQNILLIAFVFQFVVFTPFMIYCNVQLWRHKQEVYMKKRHVWLIVCTINCMWALTIRSVTTTCPIRSICGSPQEHQHIPGQMLMEIIWIYPLVVGFTARSWFLFYKLTWNEIMFNIEWWHHINANQRKHSWILKHKNSFGSFSKCMWKYLLLYVIFCITITAILAWGHQYESAEIVSSLHIMLSCVITDVILCKVPLFDAFHIRFELNVIMVIWTVITLYFGITESQHAAQKYAFFAYFKAWANILACGSIAYMTILYPIYQFKREKQTSQKMTKTDFAEYVFSCAENFNYFMHHLVKEMAVENLCFLLEVFQLKQRYIEAVNGSTETDENNFGLHIKVPSDLPQSSIVEGSDDLKQQIVLLYNKYIVDSAELQLNISWEDKANIEQKIDAWSANQDGEDAYDTANDQDHMLLIYDDALHSVMALLYGSFTRFKSRGASLDRVTSEKNVPIP